MRWFLACNFGVFDIAVVFLHYLAKLLLVLLAMTCWCEVLVPLVWFGILSSLWVSLGLPHICHVVSPNPYFKSAVWDAWNARVARISPQTR